jgi:phage repressor protein C with HTH and peptisase S24 domain
MEASDPRAALDALVTRHGESYAALSRMLGRNPAYLQQFVRRGSPRRLPERERRMLADYFRIDERLLGAPAGGAQAAAVQVPVIDAVASAGPGGLVEEDREAGRAMIDPAIVRSLGLKARDLSMITAQGESMAPTILPGDRLLVDRADRRPGAQGDVFVIRAGGALMVKRVARQGRTLSVTSDNPAHPGVAAGDVEIVGRVAWLGRALR